MGQSSSLPLKNSQKTQQKLFQVIADDSDGSERKVIKYLTIFPELINAMRGPGNGMTPLVAAVLKDQPEKVRLLLEMGASPDGRGLVGTSPLMYACENGNTVIIKMLLMNGASPQIQNNHGNTSLHHATLCNKITGPDTVKIILDDVRVNPHALDQYGRTALHLTCLCHHTKSAFVLLDHGLIDITIRDKFGKLAVDYISNEPIRLEFEASPAYQRALIRERQKAFLNVLDTLPASTSSSQRSNSGSATLVYSVLSVPELSAIICQFL